MSTAQLSKSIFNFTDTQDVRVLVGCNAFINHRGDIIKVMVIRLHAALQNDIRAALLCISHSEGMTGCL